MRQEHWDMILVEHAPKALIDSLANYKPGNRGKCLDEFQ